MTTSDNTSNIPYGYCHCGCGQKTTIAKKSSTKRGYVKGEPLRFCANHIQRTLKWDAEFRFWSKTALTANSNLCWEWQGNFTKNGYGRFRYKDRDEGTHRVAWMITHGVILDGLWVLHKCDNRKCCNPNHLFLGTHEDNMKDMVAKERQTNGEKNAQCKLTSDQVRDIKERYARGGVLQRELAAEYGVSQPAIGLIVRGVNWKHI